MIAILVKLSSDSSGIQKCLDTIDEQLTKYRLDRKKINKAMLASEELLVSMVEHAPKDCEIRLYVRRVLGSITIELFVPGESYDFTKCIQAGAPIDMENLGPDVQDRLRSIILSAFADDIRFRNRNGVNSVRLTVIQSGRTQLYMTLGAMLAAVIVGLILKTFAPATFNFALSENLLNPAKTMFMNALKMVIAPVVFFSIVSCVSQFGSLREMGKIGGKVLLLYLLTTLLATGVGIGLNAVFKPGNAAAIGSAMDATALTSQTIHMSIKDTVVDIVPDNIIRPFLESNMLQLIFMAVMCGIAVGMIGRYSRMLSEFFEACNDLFLKITTILVKFMPLAAFCSISTMILDTGTETLISVLGMCLVFVAGLILIMLIYCMMLFVFARLNPIPFVRKYAPTMLQVFSMASSNASLPVNMQTCQKKLGISPKVYSLSLPLGATMNMDGSCIYLGLFALALANVYGIVPSGAALMSVVISIIVLSIGAPGIPGSGLICLSVLLTQMGVPVEAVGLVMGIDPLIGMLRSVSNCIGDVAVTAIVAKSEGMMDIDVYRK